MFGFATIAPGRRSPTILAGRESCGSSYAISAATGLERSGRDEIRLRDHVLTSRTA
jgi:hypothetical protein